MRHGAVLACGVIACGDDVSRSLVPYVALIASLMEKEAIDCVVAQSPGCGQGIGGAKMVVLVV